MRICSRCKEQIKRGHRYHTVASRLLGFLWTVKRPAHYSCPNPTHGPSPKRLQGEVPLPFPEPESKENFERDAYYHGFPAEPIVGHAMPEMIICAHKNSVTGETSPPSPRQELADLN